MMILTMSWLRHLVEQHDATNRGKIVDGDAHREWSSKMHLKSIGAIGSVGFLKKKL